MVINFVMSEKTHSGIFKSINEYFLEYSKYDIVISEKPIKEAHIYHYHRPNKEAKLHNNSIVTIHHDLLDTDLSLEQNTFIERYKEAKVIVCLNQTQKDILLDKGINSNKIKIIPHGYNADIFDTKEYIDFSAKNKIKIGIFSKRYNRKVKGEAYFLELLKRIDKNRYEFFFIGENRYEDVKTCSKLGFSSQVFTNLEYQEFNKIYNEIDFLLILSKFEGGPANVPEALITGTPIIGFNIAMIKDFVFHNKNGFILDDNLKSDSKLFFELQNNKNNIFNTVQKEAKRNINILSWQQNISLYDELYFNIGKF